MSELEYWERQPTDNPFYVNGFDGTWTFTDHDLIPNSLTNFIMASFPKIERFKRIPLEDINTLMNDIWEGPGSMVKVQKKYLEMQANRRLASASDKDDSDVKTIDDYSDEEKTTIAPSEE